MLLRGTACINPMSAISSVGALAVEGAVRNFNLPIASSLSYALQTAFGWPSTGEMTSASVKPDQVQKNYKCKHYTYNKKMYLGGLHEPEP
jgi:hypothetical protein